jgi:5-methylcytosine-specific restriction endonuclease McrA
VSSRRLGGRRWAALRLEILERDGWVCQIRHPGCKGEATMVDHIVPRRVGGGDEPANLRAACSPCNIGRENRRRARPAPSWCTSSSLGIR